MEAALDAIEERECKPEPYWQHSSFTVMQKPFGANI